MSNNIPLSNAVNLNSYPIIPNISNDSKQFLLPPLTNNFLYNLSNNVNNTNTNTNINPSSSSSTSSLSSPNPYIHQLPPLFKLNPIPQPLIPSINNNITKTNKKSKNLPRKKRECPICHKFYSNLTTHKTIHIKDSKPFICSNCSRPFKRLNDLIRHEKCHLSKIGDWEFKCPYYRKDINNKEINSCHHTGYFTRCDTYKNHLKAIHFKYPPNTLKCNRINVSGNCRECGQFFINVNDWLNNHIENNQCASMKK